MNRRQLCALGVGGAAAMALPGGHALGATPPIGDFVTVDGLRVHLWTAGEGVPVVLIHGASGNLRDWVFDLAPRLAERHRVIAIDRPGFGHSDRPGSGGEDPGYQAQIMRAAVRQMGVERAVIVGHSYGGAVALAWALDAPDEVIGVLPLAAVSMPFGGVSFGYALMSAPVVGHAFAYLTSAIAGPDQIRRFGQRIFDPQPVPDGYLDYVGTDLALRPETLRANAEDLAALEDALLRMRGRYTGLTRPVEILHGDADRTVGASIHAKPLARELTGARLTLLPGIGHMPHHAAAEDVMAAIDRLTRA